MHFIINFFGYMGEWQFFTLIFSWQILMTKSSFVSKNLMIKYFTTKIFFYNVTFIIINEILVMNKKNLSLNFTFIVVWVHVTKIEGSSCLY